MNSQSEESSPRRPRLLTLIVVLAAAVGIAIANLSAHGATIDLLTKGHLDVEDGDCPFGWPLTWYWRVSGDENGVPQWQVSEMSAPYLATNVAIWLGMLAATAATCQWLLHRYWPSFRGRPRISTFVAMMVVAVPTLLANLSHDVGPSSWGEHYGWPLIWYSHLPGFATVASFTPEWREVSAVALAGNVLAWLLILAVAGLAWGWLKRRYRPRLRWSLKAMLAGVGLVAIACAWFAHARNRAVKQDALIELIGGEKNFRNDSFYYVERWGPKWLDVVGADRYRRHIFGARVETAEGNTEDQFKRLARLPDLRFFDMVSSFSYAAGGPQIGIFTPAMGEALGGMRQLRALNVECESVYGHISTDDFHNCIVAVGKLTQLKLLGIHMWEENIDDLARLDGLKNLTSLKLSVIPYRDRHDARSNSDDAESTGDDSEESDNERRPRTLARLPPLPRLEGLTFDERELGDEDLDRLAAFMRLKALDLRWTTVTAAGLSKLAPLEALEELAINEAVATAAGFEALAALRHLKAVHVCGPYVHPANQIRAEKAKRRAEIAGVTLDPNSEPALVPLDDRRELVVLPGELDDVRRALAVLRQSHPGIVIDAAYKEFEKRIAVKPPWFGNDRDRDLHAFARQ